MVRTPVNGVGLVVEQMVEVEEDQVICIDSIRRMILISWRSIKNVLGDSGCMESRIQTRGHFIYSIHQMGGGWLFVISMNVMFMTLRLVFSFLFHSLDWDCPICDLFLLWEADILMVNLNVGWLCAP